jgi:hypothetical protein
VSDPTGCDDNQHLPQQHKYNEDNETTNQRSDHGVDYPPRWRRTKNPELPRGQMWLLLLSGLSFVLSLFAQQQSDEYSHADAEYDSHDLLASVAGHRLMV